MLTMVGAYVHSLKIRVSAEGVQKQQHQVKDEAVLLLLDDETLQNVKSMKILHETVTGILIYLPMWAHCLASEYAVFSPPQTHPRFPPFYSAQSH